jgi:crotonobetainyl-CoA:carnitine CoA-transferase CaiB-like acyl-CoA transferase
MLDLKKPEDMERFHKLLAKADLCHPVRIW